MNKVSRVQTLDSPQTPSTGNSITRACRGRIGAMLLALGVASTGCTLNVYKARSVVPKKEAANRSANTSGEYPWSLPSEETEDKEPDEDKKEPPAHPPKPPAKTEPEQKPHEAKKPKEKEDRRTAWEKVKDKLKAEAFKKGIENKCEEKAGKYSKYCYKAAMLAADRACAKIDEYKLEPKIEEICKDERFAKLCTETNMAVADVFLAYCAESRVEK